MFIVLGINVACNVTTNSVHLIVTLGIWSPNLSKGFYQFGQNSNYTRCCVLPHIFVDIGEKNQSFEALCKVWVEDCNSVAHWCNHHHTCHHQESLLWMKTICQGKVKEFWCQSESQKPQIIHLSPQTALKWNALTPLKCAHKVYHRHHLQWQMPPKSLFKNW